MCVCVRVDNLSDSEGERPMADWKLKELEVLFSTSGYPNPNTLSKLSRSLDLTEAQIQVCVCVRVFVC